MICCQETNSSLVFGRFVNEDNSAQVYDLPYAASLPTELQLSILLPESSPLRCTTNKARGLACHGNGMLQQL